MLSIFVDRSPFIPDSSCSFDAKDKDLSVQIKRDAAYKMANSYKYTGRLLIVRKDSTIHVRISYVSSSVAPESDLIGDMFRLSEQNLNLFWEMLTPHHRTPLSSYFTCNSTCSKIIDWIESQCWASVDIDSILSDFKNTGEGKVVIPIPLGIRQFTPSHSVQNLGGSSPSDAQSGAPQC